MTKAEELANQCSNEIFDLILNNAGSHADNVSIISRAIEQYGQLVKEAAAQVAATHEWYDISGGPDTQNVDIAAKIERMKMP